MDMMACGGETGTTMKQSEEICLDPVGSHSETVTGDSCMMYELSVARGEDPHMPGIISPFPGAVAFQLSNAAPLSYSQFSSATIIKPVLFFLRRHENSAH